MMDRFTKKMKTAYSAYKAGRPVVLLATDGSILHGAATLKQLADHEVPLTCKTITGAYNKRYWHGRIPQYTLFVGRPPSGAGPPVDLVGLCIYEERKIWVYVKRHNSDRSVRDTLLHEMCHAVAAEQKGHGDAFYAQVEHLLRQGAPITVSASEAGRLMPTYFNAVPRKFPLARKAMEKFEAARVRELLAGEEGPVREISEGEIINRFEDAALVYEWPDALKAVGYQYPLLNVSGRARNEWAARIIARGKRRFDVIRKDYLVSEKIQKAWAARGAQ